MLMQAHRRCYNLISRRVSTIRAVADAIIASKAETISGEQLLHIIHTTTEDVVPEASSATVAGEDAAEAELSEEVKARVSGDDEGPGFVTRSRDELMRAGLLVTGQISIRDLAGPLTEEAR